MRRTLAFLEYKAKWWKQCATRRPCADPVLSEGLHAYAHRQADIRLKLAKKFSAAWEKRNASKSDAKDGSDDGHDSEDNDVDEGEGEEEEEEAVIIDCDEDAAELLGRDDADETDL